MKKSIKILVIAFIFACPGNILSQGCQNNTMFPLDTITAPSNFDTTIISDISWAHDYALVNEFVLGETYVFTSDSLDDLITLRSVDMTTVLAYGTQPLSYTISADTAMTIHFNTPGCGSEFADRETTIIHQFVPNIANVGVNVESPEATLDINGKIKVADDLNPPSVGMIRYNDESQDFEGYDGVKWRSFTKPLAIWGEARAPIATTSNTFIVDDGGEFDLLGTTLDIDGNYAAVTAHAQDINGINQQGSVYILKKQEGTFIFDQKILSPVGANFDQFGEGGVDLKGDFLIVGSPSQENNGSIGTADIFELDNGVWTWQITLSNNSGNFFYHFGQDVAINGQYAAVRNIDQINGVDEIFVYKKIGLTWTHIQTILSPTNSGTFGAALAFYEDQLYVGNPDFVGGSVVGGRVSIYSIDVNDNVTITDSIENVGAVTNFGDKFGREIDIDSDKIIIGSPGYLVDNIFRTGQVYIFSKVNNEWILEKTLQENPTTEFSDFGTSVSIFQNQALVSTSIFNGAPKSYIYKYEDDWELEAVLMSGGQSQSDFFGSGAEISENLILIGASRTDVGENQNQGVVYIFCK